MPRPPPALALIATLCALFSLAPPVSAQSYRLPGAALDVDAEALTLRYGSVEATYVTGIGWLNGWPAPPPIDLGGEVAVGEELLAWLGVDLPRLATVRIGRDSSLRLVFDLPALDPTALAALEGDGLMPSGLDLKLDLPQLLLPLELPDPGGGVELTLDPFGGGTRLRLSGPPMRFEIHALAHPTRLVIDLTPAEILRVSEIDSDIRPGVRYRRFAFDNGLGGSVIHVVEIGPGLGEFRVVGQSTVPSSLSELADGAFVAINGGYFDPDTFSAIGLLKIDHGLLSIPSRNRASLALDGDLVGIDRVRADVEVVADGRSVFVDALGVGLSLHSAAGALVGSPRQGVIEVRDGVVLANRVGPRTVPAAGQALVYEPELHSLAAIDPGERLQLNVSFEPRAFSLASYALEAGPLLVLGGRNAFEPEREGFERGLRILDAFTQQAAVGVRADGTVLLVVAESMTAEGLVPLFLQLGAQSAMRLDSGSSAALLLDGEVINRRSERRIVTALVWIPTPN